jgi:hypothetical protein
MGTYKFLHTRDIDRVLVDRTVRLSTLSFYRQLEGKQWIADQLEGSILVNIEELEVRNQDDLLAYTPEDRHRPWLGLGPNASVTIRNSQILSLCPEAFIFCASQGDLAGLRQAMCDDRDPANYDACLAIGDIRLLAHRIYHRGIIVEKDTRVRDLLHPPSCDAVAYHNLSLDQRNITSRPPAPSPFHKHQIFEQQQEVRIAFEPRQQPTDLPDTITVAIPKPQQIFAVQFRGDLADRATSGFAEAVS